MRTLGIDHGTVRIGLALSDELGLAAHPLKTLDTSPTVEQEIAEIVRQKRVTTVVLGLPLRMDGHRGEAASRVEAFADRLSKALRHEVPVKFVDERLTSVSAERSLGLEGKQKTKEQKKLVDQVAAVAILQDYLNTQAGGDAWLLPDEPDFR
ncbi:Holliday junction resolvase RuvX [Verrucomicrobium sp. BvORR034]|uniref:Holliday junction resolvase RuvX n=1 Tax=Verrucomicrobium sp. BvORR034 TaxID=1396418 RepID=UPI000678CFA1|nr:Holliday junction resolvase RuvX [Verrucomicrobium sp. BvORR034]